MRITSITVVTLTCLVTLASPAASPAAATRATRTAPSTALPDGTRLHWPARLPGSAGLRQAAGPHRIADTTGARASTGPKGVKARAAYLLDGTANRALWTRRPDERRAIGSITKVMTAVVVLRSGRLDREITIRPRHLAYAARRHGSTARLRPGDRLTVRELLHALLVPSGCDAAAVLAGAYGPGRRRFVQKMNGTARALGMSGTRYGDPAGLPPVPGHSTARDQVTLGRYAMRYRDFRAVVGHRQHVLRATRDHRRYVWRSTNRLLGTYPGMTGIKSGFTSAAGYSFLFAARRKGRTLVGVVLNSSRTLLTARFTDATRLLDWGFR